MTKQTTHTRYFLYECASKSINWTVCVFMLNLPQLHTKK